MKTRVLLSIFTLLITSQMNAKVHAIVNGENLTDEDIKPMLSMFHDAKSINELNQYEKKMLLDQSIEKKLILQSFKKEKLETSAVFQKVLANFKERLMVEFWMKDRLKTVTVSEEEIKKSFEKNRGQYPKESTLEAVKPQIKEQVRMEKFQLLIDTKLSEMKKKAEIAYK
ncbi:MAG: hypothetical protein K0U47_04890 [Epsilonproteobacteria bacterium]|nr:hypothetical protein [Campylobacterota bacterium]